MLKQFSNWYFDYGWILITTLCGISGDMIMSTYSVKNKKRYMIIATIITVAIIVLAIAGKSN